MDRLFCITLKVWEDKLIVCLVNQDEVSQYEENTGLDFLMPTPEEELVIQEAALQHLLGFMSLEEIAVEYVNFSMEQLHCLGCVCGCFDS